jgi:nucleoside-diphosphate-sugar epimerase
MAAGFVDVRDVAAAHVLALKCEKASNHRFVTSGGTHTHHQLLRLLRTKYPNVSGIIAPEESGVPEGKPLAELNEQSREVLGMSYRSFEDTVVGTVEEVVRRFGHDGQGVGNGLSRI